MTTLLELKGLASKTNFGKWFKNLSFQETNDAQVICWSDEGDGSYYHICQASGKNAPFIIAANPVMVTAMVDEIAKLREALLDISESGIVDLMVSKARLQVAISKERLP